MALSVRLDAKTESLIGRLARKRRQTKSEVIRDAVGVLAKQEDHGSDGKALTIWLPIWWVASKGGRGTFLREAVRNFVRCFSIAGGAADDPCGCRSIDRVDSRGRCASRSL